jgi:hypothetical protein
MALALAACGVGAGSGGSTGSGGTTQQAGRSATGYSGQSGQAATAQPTTPQTDVVPVAEGPRVIRTASLSVEVKGNGFDAAFSRIFEISTQYNGYVSGGNSTPVETGGLRSGTVTFMVPAASFQDAIASVRKLGTVQQFTIGGQDVSAQYVDLQARLKNAQAQQAAFQALLQRATTIQDIINIQNQLGQVTAQIEQLEGQIAYLDHATTYSSISVTLREAPVAPQPADSWGFKTAVLDSLHGFVNTVDWMILGLGNALPVILILAVLAGAWWRWIRRPSPTRAA